METLLLTAEGRDIETAARLLREGKTVAIPTETVYGLAADALDPSAVAAIFEAKGRPQDNPLIVHIADRGQLAPLVTHIPPEALRLADLWWPGPLTMILPRADIVPAIVSAGLPTVAVRLPAHPAARAIIKAAGTPLAAPSANISGRPSPTSAAHVLADLGGKIAAVVDGGPCGIGVESTVISLIDKPRLLRPGGVTPEMLCEVLPDLIIDQAVKSPLTDETKAAPSPGMKYQHYSPNADVIIVRGKQQEYAEYISTHVGPGTAALCFEGETDRLNVPTVTYGRRGRPEEQVYC